MKKLRVGVWISDDYAPETGGWFGYYTQLVKKIESYTFQNADIVFISFNNSIDSIKAHKKHKIIWKAYEPSKINNFINYFGNKLRIKILINYRSGLVVKNELSLKDELNKHIDVIYYPVPDCVFPNFPYIYTLWDLGHLSGFAFPEVSMNKVFENRKLHHDLYPQKALLIFAESKAGKKDIVKYLQINENRIKVVPLFSSEIVGETIQSKKPEILENDEYFIHYPAQFWPHKNHYNLLVSLQKVSVIYPKLKLIFTGSDKGNKAYIDETINAFGLSGIVLNLGFVSMEELKWLYLNSQGLVMPTLLGPTNMPLLEAAQLNCLVACSNFEGHIEQLGNYGYYYDPTNSEEMANVICNMLEDKKNGIKRSYTNNFNIDNAILAIDEAFKTLNPIRFCWGTFDNIF